jgi:hypothetical protein
MKRLRSAWAPLSGGQIVIWPAPLVGLIVAGVSLWVGPKRGDIKVDVALASMAAFLFGVLLAFTIVRTRERRLWSRAWWPKETRHSSPSTRPWPSSARRTAAPCALRSIVI